MKTWEAAGMLLATAGSMAGLVGCGGSSDTALHPGAVGGDGKEATCT
jgi:hypothetical protein